MATPGYFRFPTLHDNTVVFVSEDDLWTVPANGGVARRLTVTSGVATRPFLSPDGQTLAFTGRDEGHNEIYVMNAMGGPVRRLTYLGAHTLTMGWNPDGDRILVSSNAGQPFGVGTARAIAPSGGEVEDLRLGPAVSLSLHPDGRAALGRNNEDPARWKRYRGGTAGELWLDPDGSGNFQRFMPLKGNLARPMWVGDRVFFLSDHEGYGNLYSALPSGEDLRRHTHHADFYARFPSTDGRRIVYHAGADLFLLDPATDTVARIDVETYSPRAQRQRKFVDTARYLESYAPHPKGHSVALTARGRSFTMGNWEGAVTPQGGDPVPNIEPIRYRFTSWLNDGKRLVTVADREGEESLELHAPHEEAEPIRLNQLDIGRPFALRVSPTSDHLLLANHRNELIFVDLDAQSMTVVDRSDFRQILGFDWSPDGRWAAFGFSDTQYTSAIRLWNRDTGETHDVTEPVLFDMDPAFDPEGKYLYFLGQRDFNPVYDSLHFDLGFPAGARPFLLTLQADAPDPFRPAPHAPDAKAKKDEEEEDEDDLAEESVALPDAEESEDALETDDTDETAPGTEATPEAEGTEAAVRSSNKRKPATTPMTVDLDGITRRVVGFPVREGRYGQIAGLKGKALFTSFPIEGALGRSWMPGDAEAKGKLDAYDFESQKKETLVTGITDFQLSADHKTLYYRAAQRLRALKAGEKPDDKAPADPPGRKNGWMDLSRAKVSVDPGSEWRQMAREAWRLQREYFWTPDMSQVDWNAIWDRYAPLIERIGSRGEFSDLMWEMQGELGTSHAYEMGGDYRPEPNYPQGFLGADFAWDDKGGGYRITHIVQGTAGDAKADSPLNGPGVNVREGDLLRAINGHKLTRDLRPANLLIHQAETEVVLQVSGAAGETREVTVKTLRTEQQARYREWVEANRRRVHDASAGKVGYVHIPDMGARGYAEFHRLYLAEVARDALVVDVRYNGGGHVSQLIIEKLARRRVGYDVHRWGQPEPYPDYSVAGPMVALCNQWAGSDGDIFSHVFKLKGLGTLIGKRTWGGVIGISPRNPLADGAITTQPEFSFWFQDVGWGVENYGTDPDIEVDITPQEYARGEDPQLDRALAVILDELTNHPVERPAFADRPVLTLPILAPQGSPGAS